MTREKGNKAEKQAIAFLENKNFKIIEQNFYAKKLGEIDIIAQEKDIYHFIEVKSALDYETAVNNITFSKLSKLKRSIDYYIQKKNIQNPYCLDVIIVNEKNIQLIENITI
ncbi:MAG: YraN family protein [Arcobacter sp.]|nr:YraN family protein [Arcobacter sp.]